MHYRCDLLPKKKLAHTEAASDIIHNSNRAPEVGDKYYESTYCVPPLRLLCDRIS